LFANRSNQCKNNRMQKPFQNALTLAFTILAAGLLFVDYSQAQQTPASSNPQQPPANASPQSSASAPKKTPAAKPGQTSARKTPAPLALKTQKDKVSYAIGMSEGKRLKQGLKQSDLDVDTAILLRAIKDVLSDGKLLLTDQEAQTTLTTLQADLRKAQELRTQQLADTNKKESDAFLAANKTKEGVVTLPSGLQYKILEEGTGPKPAATDMVTVNYRGTLLNGTEFDSSYKRGQPATFNVGQIIKGWTEALELMPVGSKWQLFIPSDLAYGPSGRPPVIGPNSALVFEVELISIQPQAAAAPAPTPQPSQTPAPTAAPAPSAAPTSPTPKPAPAPVPTPTPNPTSKP
jgi:FKBP-type peptidyl-prolyl cis-trans isomerase FklB